MSADLRGDPAADDALRPVKSREQQASGVVFRARDLLVRQRTQIMNGLRGHLAEFGYVAPKGVIYVERLVAEIEDPQSQLPPAARVSLRVMIGCWPRFRRRSPAWMPRSPGARKRTPSPAA